MVGVFGDGGGICEGRECGRRESVDSVGELVTVREPTGRDCGGGVMHPVVVAFDEGAGVLPCPPPHTLSPR